jgi:uncharacterized membrane protein YkvA (DUF1232 family)
MSAPRTPGEHPRPRRHVVAAVLVGVAALIYGVSPIDIIPELLAGPLGLVDDAGVFVAAGIAIWKLLGGGQARGGARPDAGPVPPRA